MTMVTDRNRQRPVKAATYRRSCLVCGMIYNYVPAGKDKGHEHKRGLFCSWACKSAHIKANKPPPFSRVYVATCAGCSSPMVTRTKRKYCSEKCYPPPPPYVAAPRSLVEVITSRKCVECGKKYAAILKTGRPSEFCSEECKANSIDRSGRISRGIVKAKEHGVEYERFDPFEVLERDGWRCAICGIETPKQKRGTFYPDAPELDHVIPMSKGGPHTVANTQCACRRCNIDKSDSVVPVQRYIKEILP